MRISQRRDRGAYLNLRVSALSRGNVGCRVVPTPARHSAKRFWRHVRVEHGRNAGRSARLTLPAEEPRRRVRRSSAGKWGGLLGFAPWPVARLSLMQSPAHAARQADLQERGEWNAQK